MNAKLLSTIAIGMALSATVAQASLDFSSLGGTSAGSSIEFEGSASRFTVTDASGGAFSGKQWWITSSGPALFLFGRFDGGPWSYGPITVNGDDQTANVTTTTGSFTITDGSGYLATGNVNWVQVTTHSFIGGVNASATVNITGMTYAGFNTALLALVQSGDGSVDLSFQFAPGKTLTDLTSGAGSYDTSYSGSLVGVPVPEPTTAVAGMLLLLPFATGTLRILRRSRAA